MDVFRGVEYARVGDVIRYRLNYRWISYKWLPQYREACDILDTPFSCVQVDLLRRYTLGDIRLSRMEVAWVAANPGDVYDVQYGGEVCQFRVVSATEDGIIGNLFGFTGALLCSGVHVFDLDMEKGMRYDSLLTVVLHRPMEQPIQGSFYFDTPEQPGMLDIFPDGNGFLTGHGEPHSGAYAKWKVALDKVTSLCNLATDANDVQCRQRLVGTLEVLRKVTGFMEEVRAKYPDETWPELSLQYTASFTVSPSKEG